MNDSLTRALYEEFPEPYSGRFKASEESSICWGFECGDGWYALLRSLSRELTNYGSSNPQFRVEATQVKAKFGSLRFHLRESTPTTGEFIDRAREVAGRTCELTGASGSLCVKRPTAHRGARYMVLCEEKAAELGYEKASRRSAASCR